jgi:putative transcriptional regulator
MRNRLKGLRAELGWSQADLATKLEVSRQSVNAIETGKYDPSLPLAFRIARLFGKRIEEIFEDEQGVEESDECGATEGGWVGEQSGGDERSWACVVAGASAGGVGLAGGVHPADDLGDCANGAAAARRRM